MIKATICPKMKITLYHFAGVYNMDMDGMGHGLQEEGRDEARAGGENECWLEPGMMGENQKRMILWHHKKQENKNKKNENENPPF